MKETLFQAIQIILSVFEVWLCYQLLFETVIEKEYLRKIDRCIIWGNIFILGILLGINRKIVFFSNNMFIIVVAITAATIIFIDRKRISRALTIIFAYYSILALLDYYFAFISMPVWGDDFIHVVYWYTVSWGKSLIFTASRLIVFGVWMWIKRKKNLRRIIDELHSMLALVDVLFSILIVEYQIMLQAMTMGSHEMNGERAAFSLLIIVVIFVSVLLLTFKNKIVQKENLYLLLQEEMLEKKYRELKEEREKNRELLHDIKNHFLVLKEYEKSGDYEKIYTYIQEIEQEFRETSIHMWTGNQIVDLILEQKKAVSEQQGISFLIQAVPIQKWPLKDSELCSLFGNLLDNAVEASCKNCSSRRISVKIKRQKRLIFIMIENDIDEELVVVNNKLISTKSDSDKHGYGLKNIRRIVEIHKGEFIYEIRDGVFRVSISFFDE